MKQKQTIGGRTMIIREKEAAKILNLSVQTLRNWRHLKKGPAYLKLGRSVRYRPEDLYEFAQEKRVDHET